MKKKNIDYSSSFPYLIDINWLIGLLVNWLIGYISCKVTRRKNSYDWENKKIYKKFITWTFGKISCFTKSSKQDRCYLVLLKVQYESAK